MDTAATVVAHPITKAKGWQHCASCAFYQPNDFRPGYGHCANGLQRKRFIETHSERRDGSIKTQRLYNEGGFLPEVRNSQTCNLFTKEA